jgi:alkanesulfonate monooxygenase SsuD/methylene tetrahydromethanopterin reductase-like flavin-dependent oxidoreductase (luciferase family)
MLFHNPVVLARRFATLDVLSEGRTICGLGIGWSKDEYQVSNIPFKERGKRADEFIQALKRIWTDDVVEFKGKFYNIPASKIGPKPIQKPAIPIYLGGFSPNTFSRIIRYGLNGWLGVVGGPLEYIENTIKSIKGQASQVNKNPDNFQIVVAAYPRMINWSILTIIIGLMYLKMLRLLLLCCKSYILSEVILYFNNKDDFLSIMVVCNFCS